MYRRLFIALLGLVVVALSSNASFARCMNTAQVLDLLRAHTLTGKSLSSGKVWKAYFRAGGPVTYHYSSGNRDTMRWFVKNGVILIKKSNSKASSRRKVCGRPGKYYWTDARTGRKTSRIVRSSRGNLIGGAAIPAYRTIGRSFLFDVGKYIGPTQIYGDPYGMGETLSSIESVLRYSTKIPIYMANVSNAKAVWVHTTGKRYILYNDKFRELADNPDNFGAAFIQVLAHELGHHLAWHSGSNYRGVYGEIEADYISGQIMKARGGSLFGATWFDYHYGTSGRSSTHPAKCERLRAIWMGYESVENIRANQSDAIELRLRPEYYNHLFDLINSCPYETPPIKRKRYVKWPCKGIVYLACNK